MSRWGITSRKP